MGIGFQAQLVLLLIDLLYRSCWRYSSVCPAGYVVSGSPVVISGFKIQVLPAVAEGVGVKNIWVLLVAEGVVVDAGLLQ